MSELTADQYCDEGCLAERSGKRASALACYEQAVAGNPNHYRALLLGANLLTAWGRREEATHWAERAFGADRNEFARALLVEALLGEAMEAGQRQEGEVDFARLLWIGARLLQLEEPVRAQAVLDFVHGTAGQDAARIAGMCLAALKGPSDGLRKVISGWVEAGLSSSSDDVIPVEVLLAFCNLLGAKGSHSELTYLQVPKSNAVPVSVALDSDKRHFSAPGVAPELSFAPAVTRAVAQALEGDSLGAAMVLYDWLKDAAPLEFGVYGGRGAPTVEALRERGVLSYPVLDFGPSSAGRHPSKVQALEYLLAIHYLSNPTAVTRPLIVAFALTLCRWYGNVGKFDVALAHIESAMTVDPYAMHLRAAQYAARARLNGEKMASRFDKFVGDDSGYLKGFVCDFPFTRLDIDQAGGARVCCGHWMPQQIGNVMQQEPIEIMNSAIAKKIKRSVLDGDYRYCNHIDCNLMVGETLRTREQIGEQTLARWDKNDRDSSRIEQFLFAFDQTCNLSCPSCRRDKIVEKSSLSQRKVEVIEQKIAPLLKGLKKLDINPAGELFASKLARRMLTLVNPKDNPELLIDIISNGTLFNESNWNDLSNVHALVGTVRISVDSCTKSTFEKLRRLGVWEEFLANMKFLRDLRRANKFKTLLYSFTYQLDNFREMEDFVHFGTEMGCDIVVFEKLQNLGTFSLQEYRDRAVHHPEHPLHAEYLSMIARDTFYQSKVGRDFEPPASRQT